jgi:sarcosine oxidase subunit delta
MLLIPCPHCGPRPEIEFTNGGEAHIQRPAVTADNSAWAQRLFLRKNPKGWARERWRHSAGCGRWFNLCRHTATNDLGQSYTIGAAPPEFPDPKDKT